MSNIFSDIENILKSKDDKQMEIGCNKILKLCMSDVYQNYNKFMLFKLTLKYNKELGLEILSRWRDGIVYSTDEEPVNLKVLVKSIRLPELISHERLYTNVHLYNQGYYVESFKCFRDLAFDFSMNIKHRLDATKYLFIAGGEYKDLALKQLKDVINDTDNYTSKFRYESLASYITKKGISSLMNFKKIKIPYDEEFVYQLQIEYFKNLKNDLEYRILSGQHLLQMEDDKIKDDVIVQLFDIAENILNSENIRADATDVILRLGDSKSKKKARDIIMSLGYTGDGRSAVDKIKTVYSNSQNVHDNGIYKCIEKYIEKIFSDSGNYKLISFEDVIHSIIRDSKERFKFDKEKYCNSSQKISKAIDRITVDTATFTKNDVGVSELLCHVWSRILSKEFSQVESYELKLRLFEELYEMADTCSSGHAARIVNVMASVDENMMISWEEQIKSNLLGRIQSRMKKCIDPDLSSGIALGMMEDADEEDKIVYKKWIEEQISELETELETEFVNEGYIDKSDFDKYFKYAKSDWI